LIIDKNNFYDVIDELKTLPNIIDEVTEKKFKEVYSADSSRKDKGIVYILRCERKISRLKGKSNIVYIGQTKGSYGTRYSSSAKVQATSKANKLKYEYIVKNYGAIRISLCSFNKFGPSLLEAEGQLLWWYFQNHFEYPPLNYTKTKIRTDAIQIKDT